MLQAWAKRDDFFSTYRTLEEIDGLLDKLEAGYPALVQKVVRPTRCRLGQFHEGSECSLSDGSSLQVVGETIEKRRINGIIISAKSKSTEASFRNGYFNANVHVPFHFPGHGDKPTIVINGGQHAREWISPMTNMWIANQLLTQYGLVCNLVIALATTAG